MSPTACCFPLRCCALEFRISPSSREREGRNSGGSGWERCLPASLSPIYAAALLRRGVERRREGERQQVGGRAAHGGAWGPQVSQAARLLIAAVRVLPDGRLTTHTTLLHIPAARRRTGPDPFDFELKPQLAWNIATAGHSIVIIISHKARRGEQRRIQKEHETTSSKRPKHPAA